MCSCPFLVKLVGLFLLAAAALVQCRTAGQGTAPSASNEGTDASTIEV
jgi:hypothetical protein